MKLECGCDRPWIDAFGHTLDSMTGMTDVTQYRCFLHGWTKEVTSDVTHWVPGPPLDGEQYPIEIDGELGHFVLSVNQVRRAKGLTLECEYFVHDDAGQLVDCHRLATCVVTHYNATTGRTGIHDYCPRHGREMANRVCEAEGIMLLGAARYDDPLARANPVPVVERDDDEEFLERLRQALGTDTQIAHIGVHRRIAWLRRKDRPDREFQPFDMPGGGPS